MLAAYTAQLAKTRKELADLPKMTQIVKKDRWSGKPTTYTPSDPYWKGLISEIEQNLKHEIRQLEQNIPILQNEITNWKPTEVKKQKGMK
jgi:sugar-specific transcriptional regulator TrmB